MKTNHNILKGGILFVTLFLFSFTSLTAQTVTISGDGNMEVGQQKTFSVNSGGNSVYWIIDGSGGSIENGQGTSQVTVEATTGANFQIRVQLNNGSAGIGGKEITVTPLKPDNPTISYVDCQPILTRGTPPSGVTWYWQGTNANGTNDTNSSLTYSPSSDGNYRLRAKSTSQYGINKWSVNSAGKVVTLPTAPSTPSVSGNLTRTICSGETTTFSISGATTDWTYKWYEGANEVQTGTSFPTSPTSSKTYTVKVTDDKGCVSPARTVQVNVSNVAKPSAGNNSNSCSAQSSVQITATSASGFSGEHIWYTSSDPNNNAVTNKTVSIISTNGQYVSGITVNSSDQKDYWVAEKIGLCISDRRQVTATFDSFAVDAGSINGAQTVCYNGNPAVLGNQTSASGGEAISYQWQISATGNSNDWSNITTNGTSATYDPPALQSTKWYRRLATACQQSSATASVKITVRAALTPGSINGGGQTLCQGDTVGTLGNAANPTGGNTGSYSYNWYVSNSQNGPWSSAISGATSNTYTPPATIGTRWYRRSVTSCNQTMYTTAQSVMVNAVPSAPSTTDASNTCDSNVVTLTATSTSTGVNHIWYTTQFGSNTVTPTQTNNGATVSSYNVTLSGSDISYWVAAEQNGCISARTEVKAEYMSMGSTPTIALVDSSTDTDRCGSGNFILTANITNGSSSNLNWYDGAGSNATQVGTGSSLQIALDYDDMDSTGKKKFWVEGTLVNSSNCSFPMANRISIEVSLDELPSAPTTTESTVMRCGSGDVALTANVNSGTIEWFDAPTGGNSQGTGNSLTTTITQTKTFYAESISSDGCRSVSRLPIEAQITTGITWYPDGDADGFADSTDSQDIVVDCNEPAGDWTTNNTLDNCVGEFSTNNVVRRWYDDSDNDTLGNPSVFLDQCEQPQGYVLDNTDQCPGITSTTNDCNSGPVDPVNCDTTPDAPNDPTDQNYIYTRNYQIAWPGSVPTSKFDNDNSYIQDITYFDGLGRPTQQIAIRHSPNKKDIIAHSGYDDYGRQDKTWLPFEDGSNNALGNYRTGDMEMATKQYYKTNYADDFVGINVADINPYSEQKYEPSPLNRVEKQAAPGEDWKMDNGHEVEMVYSANMTNEVRRFKISLAFTDNTYDPTLAIDGSYPAGELSKTISKDENHSETSKNHTTETFTDKQGRVLLKRNYADVTNSDGSVSTAEPHDTYYIYDDYGNLTYVLPPLMEGTSATLTQINNNMADLGYEYRYDHRNRLVQKRIPAKEWEYMIYNKLDQPVMTQDANQRTSGEWLFTKYDAFGRLAYTGKSIEMDGANPKSRIQVQNAVNGITTDLWVNQGGSYTFDNEPVHYNNGAYPTTTISEVLTVSYYDNYDDFDLPAGAPTSVTLLGSSDNETNTTKVYGLATGGKVKVLDQTPAKWIKTITYYDEKARPIYTFSLNDYLQATDIAETQLDFVGRPVKTKTSHTKNGRTIVTQDFFTYDHVGRLLTQTQCIDGDCESGGNGSNIQADRSLNGTINTTETASNSITVTNATLTDGAHLYIDANGPNAPGDQELIVLNEYDNLGLLKFKKVGGEVATDVQQSNGLQKVDYAYNVRGWTKKINGDTHDDNDLFNFEIKHNDIADTNKKLYNGNISQTLWSTSSVNTTANPVSTGYTYTYDALNRITDAVDNTTLQNYSLENVAYDKNGNITDLKRKGHLVANPVSASDFGVMDDLDYTYVGNQLQRVSDLDGADTGFFDGNPGGGTDYSYDDNGNMIFDANKNISSIEYNYLNLPTKVVMSGNGKNGTIEYIYDATGTKLKKIATDNVESSVKTTEYCSGYIYEGNATTTTLQFFGQGEGYVKVDGTDYTYVYQYTDHLGNVRLSYTQDPADDSLEIVEENNYYPFGLKHKGYNGNISTLGSDAAQRWKFGGKEYMQDMDLDWYDVSARNYDPALGRWMNIDPLADQMRRHSPYNYAFDNPIYFTDSDGMMPTDGYGEISEGASYSYSGPSASAQRYAQNTRTVVKFKDGRKVTLSSEEDHAAFFNAQSKGKKGDLDKPSKVNIYTDARELVVNILLWGVYINQNPDETVYASDIIDHKYEESSSDDAVEFFGGDPSFYPTTSNMASYQARGEAQLTYIRDFVTGSDFMNSARIERVRWEIKFKSPSIVFKSEKMQSSGNFFSGDSRNSMDVIWLSFYPPRARETKGFQIRRPKNPKPLFSDYIKNMFNPSRGTYDLDKIKNLQNINHVSPKK